MDINQSNDLVSRALAYATQQHKKQFRKGPGNEPYINHCIRVADELRSAGYDPKTVAAGILHDTVEDTSTTCKDLENLFGKKVADLVMTVTEKGENMTWGQRLVSYSKRVKKGLPSAKAISAADKIDNMTSMSDTLKSGFNIFQKMHAGPEQQIAKFRGLREVLKPAISPMLQHDYDKALKTLTKTLTKKCLIAAT